MAPSVRGGGRPPSGMRLATGQRGRVDPNQPSVGVMASSSLNIDARPVTQQGLTGMRTKALGPGRQIADKSYFLSELRSRLTAITGEITKMRAEEVNTGSGNAKYGQYERKYEEMIAEVRTLEGELADFNLALDKVRTNTNLNDIDRMFESLQERNKVESGTGDQIFIKTKQHDKRTKELNSQIDLINQQASERIRQLGPDVAREYDELLDENSALQQAIVEREGLVQSLDQKISFMNGQLQSKEFQTHLRGVQLEKKSKQLKRSHDELTEEVNSHLSPEEMRDKLLQKVKDANADIAQHEQRSKMLEEQLETYQDLIREKEQELSEAKKHALKAKKYEAVYERDRKMQEFIDQFPTAMQGEKENIGKLKNTIVALLKHISKGIASAENVPDQEKLADMRSELSFKEQTLANSKSTLQALEKDLAKRKDELEKIDSLDIKINNELKALKEKMSSMNREMGGFKSEEELQIEASETKRRLLKEKSDTRKTRDGIKQQVQLEGVIYDRKKRELAGNDVFKKVEVSETKLKTMAASVFTLSDYISTRKRESDYKGVAKEILASAKKNQRFHHRQDQSNRSFSAQAAARATVSA